MDYATASAEALLQRYGALCDACRVEQLEEALSLLRECIRAERADVLVK